MDNIMNVCLSLIKLVSELPQEEKSKWTKVIVGASLTFLPAKYVFDEVMNYRKEVLNYQKIKLAWENGKDPYIFFDSMNVALLDKPTT